MHVLFKIHRSEHLSFFLTNLWRAIISYTVSTILCSSNAKKIFRNPKISLQAFYARFRKQIHTAQNKIKQMAAKRTM